MTAPARFHGHGGPVRHCVVCGAALGRELASARETPDPFPACGAVACRMVVQRRTGMSEAGFRHYLALEARQRRYMAELGAAVAARAALEARENAGAWEAMRARLTQPSAEEPLLLVLPTGPRRSRPVPAARRERYRLHLARIVEEARAASATAPPEDVDAITSAAAAADGSGMAGRLCAFCGGGCCTKGGEHAYLGAATVRRFMDRQPGMSNEEVLAAYLERLPAAGRTGSCINHTASGCSLPRAMRSDICNRFACEPLARVEAAAQGPAPLQAIFIVRRKQDHWRSANPALENAVNACAVLDERGLRRMPPALPAFVSARAPGSSAERSVASAQ